MDASWASTSGSVELSRNSTIRSGVKEMSLRNNDRSLLVELALSKGSVDRRIAIVENPNGLLRGLHRVHDGISLLLQGQQKTMAKSDALREQADLYSELLQRFQNRPYKFDSSLSHSDMVGSTVSGVETARATCPNPLRQHFSTIHSDELAGCKPCTSGSSSSPTNKHASEHISLHTYVGTPLNPSIPLKEEALNVSKSSIYSMVNSYLLDKPLASSSPCSKLSKADVEPCHQLVNSKLIREDFAVVQKPTFKSQGVQVSAKVTDRSVEVDVQDNVTRRKRKEKRQLSVKNAAVQVAFVKSAMTHEASVVPDEGFSEPTEPLSSTDRNKSTKNIAVIPPLDIAVSPRGDCLTARKVFVPGTSTSSSHSVYINAQQLLHSLKLSDPTLYMLFAKIQAPPTVEEFLKLFITKLHKEIERLREEIRKDIRLYDQLNNELFECEEATRANELSSRQAETVGRIGKNDFQVRRLEAKIKAAEKDLKCLTDKTAPRSYRICGSHAYGWLRPTLSSQDKAVTDRNSMYSNNGAQVRPAQLLRDMKSIKQFVDRNTYVRVSH